MNSISVINSANPGYPQQLHKLHDPPKRLFILGDITALETSPILSVVGSRKVTAYGRRVTDELIQGLRGSDTIIVSGLAFGIDSLAHKAALKNGLRTIAILPGGLDRIYPSSHQSLAEEILKKGGALISEYSNGTRAAKYHFPARNRIVAALADAVLVIEAAEKSGTLITAEHALDIGVNVLAVPGNITSPQSIGTNKLLQTGAGLIDSVASLRSELGISTSTAGNSVPTVNSKQEQQVIDSLKDGALSTTELCEKTKIEAGELNRLLTALELSSHVVNRDGNVWSL